MTFVFEGRMVSHLVHRMVLSAFFGEQPSMDANHINGDKFDNRLANLEWVTRQRNLLHAIEHGLARRAKGETHPRAKLTDDQVRAIRDDSRPLRVVGAAYGISSVQVLRIRRREKWAHLD